MSKISILFEAHLIFIILLWSIDESLPIIVVFVHLLPINWWRVGILSTDSTNFSSKSLFLLSVCLKLLIPYLISLDSLVFQTTLNSGLPSLWSLLVETFMNFLKLLKLFLLCSPIITIISLQFLLFGIFHLLNVLASVCQWVWTVSWFWSRLSFLSFSLWLENLVELLRSFEGWRRWLLSWLKTKICIHLIYMHLKLLPSIVALLLKFQSFIILTLEHI